MLTSCGNDRIALEAAATRQAQAQARVNIASQPDDCARREPHAWWGVGSDKMVVLKLESRALDRANDRVQRCYELREAQAKALR